MTATKTELRLVPHTEIPGALAVELWYGGTFIGTVVGADCPGVRVISKNSLYPQALVTLPAPTETGVINMCQVRIAL
jgi:hypothetical protein